MSAKRQPPSAAKPPLLPSGRQPYWKYAEPEPEPEHFWWTESPAKQVAHYQYDDGRFVSEEERRVWRSQATEWIRQLGLNPSPCGGSMYDGVSTLSGEDVAADLVDIWSSNSIGHRKHDKTRWRRRLALAEGLAAIVMVINDDDLIQNALFKRELRRHYSVVQEVKALRLQYARDDEPQPGYHFFGNYTAGKYLTLTEHEPLPHERPERPERPDARTEEQRECDVKEAMRRLAAEAEPDRGQRSRGVAEQAPDSDSRLGAQSKRRKTKDG
ncbi:MAG: hypothetical protein M1816_004193 [Peltula sp. TS41687]|nr:MAG: hypothetical protein M1816_004193 [Peltula sp. TS41687]